MRTEDAVNKSEREAYYTSREWGLLKERVRQRCGGICERCLVNEMYACHHLTYGRVGNELLTDLQGLCEGCHEWNHAKTGDDPRESGLSRVVRELVRTWTGDVPYVNTFDFAKLLSMREIKDACEALDRLPLETDELRGMLAGIYFMQTEIMCAVTRINQLHEPCETSVGIYFVKQAETGGTVDGKAAVPRVLRG